MVDETAMPTPPAEGLVHRLMGEFHYWVDEASGEIHSRLHPHEVQAVQDAEASAIKEAEVDQPPADPPTEEPAAEDKPSNGKSKSK